MKVQIERPFFVSMDVLEADDNIPSFKIALEVRVDQFQNSFNYVGEFWIKCSDWDDFFRNLDFHGDSVSCLQDIDENMCFTINLKKLNWSVKKEDKYSNKSFSINFYAAINDDEFWSIKEQFNNFPKWW